MLLEPSGSEASLLLVDSFTVTSVTTEKSQCNRGWLQ